MDQNIIIAAAAGFFIGAVLVWIIKNTNQSNAEHLQEESEALRKEYEALKKTFADYRNNVNGHFIRTAEAVEQLADGYKNVYHQLSSGARALMDKETLQKQIEKRQNKTITLGFAADSGDSAPAAPAAQPAEKPAPVPPKPVAKPAPAETAAPAAPAAAPEPPAQATPAPATAEKNETPQEAVKRHLQNNQGKTP